MRGRVMMMSDECPRANGRVEEEEKNNGPYDKKEETPSTLFGLVWAEMAAAA